MTDFGGPLGALLFLALSFGGLCLLLAVFAWWADRPARFDSQDRTRLGLDRANKSARDVERPGARVKGDTR